MAIYKNKDIETNIKATRVNMGDIDAQFYSDDKNSASIRIYIKHNNEPINLATANLTPILSLSMQDGSYFDNEPVDIVLAEQGLIQYKIRENVIKHVGRVRATLELKGNSQSIHACEFSFSILNSGKYEQIAKEINIDLIGDKIKEVLVANKEIFKGEKGDAFQYKDFTPEQLESIRGKQGQKGDPFLYSDFTQSQLASLKGEKGDNGVTVSQSIPLTLLNGVQAVSDNRKPIYKVIDFGDTKQISLSGMITNVNPNTLTTIGTIPFKPYVDYFISNSSTSSVTLKVTTGGTLSIQTTNAWSNSLKLTFSGNVII